MYIQVVCITLSTVTEKPVLNSDIGAHREHRLPGHGARMVPPRAVRGYMNDDRTT